MTFTEYNNDITNCENCKGYITRCKGCGVKIEVLNGKRTNYGEGSPHICTGIVWGLRYD